MPRSSVCCFRRHRETWVMEVHGDGGCGSRQVSAAIARTTGGGPVLLTQCRPQADKPKCIASNCRRKCPFISDHSCHSIQGASERWPPLRTRPPRFNHRAHAVESWPWPENVAMSNSIGKAEPHCACRLQSWHTASHNPSIRARSSPYPRLKIADTKISKALAGW